MGRPKNAAKGGEVAPVVSLTRARGITPLTEVEQRVRRIVDLMISVQYRTGTTPAELAAEWGCSESAVRGYAAEANRIVRAAVNDPEEVARDIGARLQRILETGSDRDAAMAARVWGEVTGAMAPRQIEVRHESSLSDAELRERLAALARRATELSAVPPAQLVDGPCSVPDTVTPRTEGNDT